MLHELKRIVAQARIHQERGGKSVLATVVDLQGSSYRKPGVRMLIADSGKITGALSGGCVEKEICRRAQSVFVDGEAKVVTYDGRFRLGCEGLLFVLLEPFYVSDALLEAFSQAIKRREVVNLTSCFEGSNGARGSFRTQIQFHNGDLFCLSQSTNPITATQGSQKFEQTLQPCFRLLIIGSEHDAVQLCLFASLLGWEVEILSSSDPKDLRDFPGAQRVCDSPLSDFSIDRETAVVLMTHNYASDLKYLSILQAKEPAYIGVLGSKKRVDLLQNDIADLMTMRPMEASSKKAFTKLLFSPTGLDIGAITPGEIALSILAEITSVMRERKAVSLRSIERES